MANEFKIKNGLIVSGSADFEQDLRVRGTLTVDELHTSITSSSIIYESGSTRFGDTIDDTHTFTGSVNITGSISLNGQAIGTGKLDETTFNSYTSSISSSMGGLSSSIATTTSGLTSTITSLSSSLTSSIGSLSSSIATTTSGLTSTITSLSSSLSSSIDNLSSSVASINNTQNGRLDLLETASGSIRTDFNSFTSSYTTVSSSLDSRLDVLEAYSGSQQVPTASYSLRTTRTDVYCKNMSGAQINKGTVVRITGAVGDNPLIGVASLLTEGQSANTLGIAAENIPNDSFGLVITEGVLLGVNTSGMTPGQLIFLGANGTFTTSYPVAPNHGVRLGEVLRDQQNQGSIYVRVDNGSELGEAHDVYDTTTNSSYGDLLVKSGSVWINSRKLNGNYEVTGSLTATSFTGSINYNNLTNVPTLVSGSSQILDGSNVVSSSTQVTNYGFAITGSNLFKGNQTHSGSIIPAVDNTYDLGSPTYQWRDVYISSGSLYIDGTKVISSTTQELQITTDNGQSIKILESGTDSIILQTADGDIELKSNADGDILLDPTNGKIMLKGPVEILNGQKIQSSVGGTPVVFANDIVVSGSIDITGTIEGIDLTAFSSSVNTRLSNLESAGGNLNTFTASANTRLGNLETESGSIRTTVNSYTSSTNNRLTSIETTTGSILSTNTTQDGRLTSIESKTGSYATTGSNIFQGNQTITGSLYVSQDLIIAGSSSIQHISSSVVNIADNIITVNAQNPSIRFGGLAVIDSGSSPQVSGSILFDSTNDQWIFVHQNQTTVTSSVLLMGPQTYNNLGSEAFPTTNRILKSLNAEHVGDSNISDNGTTVTILSNTIINGTISATGTTIVSGSSQISFNGITDKPALVSGSSQVSFNGITDKPALVSGSAQISFNTITDKPTLVSGSSQISYPSLSNIPSGIVSGSSQIDLTATTNYSSGIKTRLNAENVLSSSVQVVSALPAGTVSGSSQITFGSISSIPSGLVSGSSQVLAGTTIHSGSFFNGISVVSGSSQVSFNGITDKPALVSGSSQITYSGISSIPSGIVSGSSQVLSGTGIWSGSAQLPAGVVSGSAQTIANLPVGTVSGSSQVTGIGNSQLTNSSFNVGTTSISLGRASASQTLTGVSIDGNAATVTNGVYTTGDQTIAGVKTFSNKVVFNSAVANRPQFPGGILGIDTGDGNFDIWGISTEYYPSHATSANAWGLRWNGNNNDFEFVGGGTNRVILDMDGGVVTATTFSGALSGNATTATTAGALTSMNISQFTNNSGYITGINSSAVTTALGYTPYNATNPNGYITGISFANVSSKPTTISGYGITDAITTGNIGSQSVSNAATVASLTPFQFFNNMGQNHSTQTDFNSISNFGFRFVQGSTNGPGTGSSQFYGFSIGLGNDYAYSDYALQLAIPRYPASDKYITFRTREATTWGSWNKISAGYADSAGSVSGANVSGNISGNASNITSYTINQSVGTGNAVQFSSVGVGVSPAVTLHARGSGEMVRFENTSSGTNEYTQLNFKAGTRNGYIWLGNQNTSSWAGAGGLNIYTENGHMDFWTTAVQRIRIQNDGHMVPFVSATYNLGSSSLRWNTVFTSDLSLSNGIGDYTIVEGEEKLYLYNNKNNKVYSFVLQEEDPTTATPKKS